MAGHSVAQAVDRMQHLGSAIPLGSGRGPDPEMRMGQREIARRVLKTLQGRLRAGIVRTLRRRLRVDCGHGNGYGGRRWA